MTIPTPGIYPHMTNDEYQALRREGVVSNSDIKHISRSVAHYEAHIASEGESRSTALVLGQAVHDAILTPHEFEATFRRYSDTKSRNTKAYEAWEAANPGKVGLLPDEYEMVERVRDAVLSHPVAKKILTADALCEESHLWTDEATGLPLRCRPDIRRADMGALFDLKTTEDASEREFSRSIARWSYHQQAAFYLDGVTHTTGERYEQFGFVAVEKSAPFAVAVYELDPEDIEHGRARYRAALDKLAAHKENPGAWSGYPDTVTTITLPAWAK